MAREAPSPEWHVIVRARERYGLAFTPADIAGLEYLIALDHPTTVRLGREPAGGELVAVRARGQWLPFVLHGQRIVTVLPVKTLNAHRKRLDARKRELLRDGLVPASPRYFPPPHPGESS